MSLKLIREAQTIDKLGDKVDFYKNAQEALGVKSLTETVSILAEDEDYNLTPAQIIDQIGYLAKAEGINPSGISQRDFKRLAGKFRIELEDHYDEVYPNTDWNKMVSVAWVHHFQSVNGPAGQFSPSAPEENEEDYDYGDDREDPEEPTDPYDRARANGYKGGSRANWEFDRATNGAGPGPRTRSQENEELSTGALLNKCARVVKSIKTRDQYEAAKKYANLVFQKVNDEIHRKKGFGGLGDSTSLLKAIKSDLHAAFNRVSQGEAQENEERGWPSDEASEDDAGQYRQQGEMGAGEWDDLNNEINQPWDQEEDNRELPQTDGDNDEEYPWPGDEDMNGRFQENEERSFDRTEARAINGSRQNTRGDGGNMSDALKAVDHLWGSSRRPSQEQRGWEDAKRGATPRYPNDTEYMTGHQRGTKLAAPRTGVENEENTSDPKSSLLKSLLTQRKEVSAKASETAKKYKKEGAAAFHEIRMKHCKSPYCPQKQSDEHSEWMKGWEEAAKEHYTPEEIDPKARAKAKKQAAKPKR